MTNGASRSNSVLARVVMAGVAAVALFGQSCHRSSATYPPPETLMLWSGQAPGATGREGSDPPSLEIYLVPPGQSTGTAIIVMPGGGYVDLADHEGSQVAHWLRRLGVNAFVLRYRHAPHHRYPAPFLDAQRAVRTVRAHAEEWGIAPQRIGVMGFSAGGHLASTVGTHFDVGDPAAPDPIERVSSRPDFMVLVYPVISMNAAFTHDGTRANLVGEDAEPELLELLSNEHQVTPETPPTLLIHTDADAAVPAENSVAFYLALREANIPSELHVFQDGDHGLGLGRRSSAFATWKDLCRMWMKERGLLAAE